jgi:hypothetical protein
MLCMYAQSKSGKSRRPPLLREGPLRRGVPNDGKAVLCVWADRLTGLARFVAQLFVRSVSFPLQVTLSSSLLRSSSLTQQQYSSSLPS